MIKCIVCADNNWAIGKNNGLLYQLKEDMKHFQQSTIKYGENFIVMGENTFKSLPNSKPLKNRINIVLCKPESEYEDCICIHDFYKLVDFIKILAKTYTVWIIGGAMLYQSMLPFYDEIIVTKVDAQDSEATAYFPDLDELVDDFKIVEESKSFEDNGYNIRFVIYKRMKEQN